MTGAFQTKASALVRSPPLTAAGPHIRIRCGVTSGD